VTRPRYAVLGNFAPIEMSKPVPQGLTLELSAYAFAKVRCMLENISGKEAFNQVYNDVREKFAKYALSPSQIKQRQLVFFPRMEDIRLVDGEFDLAEPEHEYLQLYKDKTNPRGANIKERHESFGKIVDLCLSRMYEGDPVSPDDIVHVTCSGYLAPSPVEKMVARLEWFDTTVTHSYHMGCYGAFPAIRMAHGFLASSHFGVTPPKRQVDIVHTELLSMHNDFTELRAENIITSTLFADGFIKYSLFSEEYIREQGLPGLRVLAMNEHILPDSLGDMTWVPGAHQFHMTLTVMVPIIIKKYVRSFIDSLLNRAGVDFNSEKDSIIFAIHPGGPKIVEHIQTELGLRADQVAISQKVFEEHGNMSSTTIPHILKEILEEKAIPVGTRIVSIAFGPGLTVTGLVLEKI